MLIGYESATTIAHNAIAHRKIVQDQELNTKMYHHAHSLENEHDDTFLYLYTHQRILST